MGKPEGKIEMYLKEKAEQKGFLCYKLVPSKRGIPDRILIGYGHTLFVETKREKGGKLSAIQKIRIKEMTAHGADVYVCDTKELIDELLNRYMS